MDDQEAFEALAELVAERVLSKLQERMTFPTTEDVERIRDHVDPNGVAYRNGKRDELARVVWWLKDDATVDETAHALARALESGEHWR